MDRFTFERHSDHSRGIRIVADYDSERDVWVMVCRINGHEFDRRETTNVFAEAQDLFDLALRPSLRAA